MNRDLFPPKGLRACYAVASNPLAGHTAASTRVYNRIYRRLFLTFYFILNYFHSNNANEQVFFTERREKQQKSQSLIETFLPAAII